MNIDILHSKVVNIRFATYDTYIGRGSIWGNPFTHKANTKADIIVKTRDEAIERYEKYILSRPDLIDQIESLRNKVLGCYCKPQNCHGDVLIEFLKTLENQNDTIRDDAFW